LWFGENARFRSKTEKRRGLKVLIRSFLLRGSIRDGSKVRSLLGLPQQPSRKCPIQVTLGSLRQMRL
jgi:hypothetical protein